MIHSLYKLPQKHNTLSPLSPDSILQVTGPIPQVTDPIPQVAGPISQVTDPILILLILTIF